MKRQALVMTTLISILFVGSLNWTACSTKKTVAAAPPAETAEPAPPPPPAPPAEAAPPPPPERRGDPPFIAAIKEQIKGKEEMPAEEVFENIQAMKGVPAGRIIPIMQQAFNRGLGVRCNHCHEFGKWSSDVNPKKQVARDMWVMTGRINQELLGTIQGLQSVQPTVNCTTCHRGDAIPKTSMD